MDPEPSPSPEPAPSAVQANWEQEDSGAPDFILNKPEPQGPLEDVDTTQYSALPVNYNVLSALLGGPLNGTNTRVNAVATDLRNAELKINAIINALEQNGVLLS